jgi:hypothetical protein
MYEVSNYREKGFYFVHLLDSSFYNKLGSDYVIKLNTLATLN